MKYEQFNRSMSASIIPVLNSLQLLNNCVAPLLSVSYSIRINQKKNKKDHANNRDYKMPIYRALDEFITL